MFLKPQNHRRLHVLGLLFLIAFNLVNWSNRWIAPAWRDRTDAVAGFAMGVAIGLMLLSIHLRARQLRGEGNPPCA